MSKRKPAPQPLRPTVEQVKAQIDSLDRANQFNLFVALTKDPKSHVGELILSLAASLMHRVERLEKEAGLAPEDMDPHELLGAGPKRKSHKQIKRELGCRTRNAAKQAKHKAKVKAAALMARLQRTMPPLSLRGGRVVQVHSL